MTGLISSLISTISSAAVVAAVKDLYYNYVTLLLHGEGTNTAQNNTFVDSSTNALTITRNGNITQGSFSPFSLPDGNWSNYFDGSSGYYFSGTGSSTPFTFGTSTDFTMEGWFYLNVTSGDSNYRTILSSYDNRTGNYGFILGLYTTGTPQFEAYTNGLSLKSTTTLQTNVWYNFAYTRSGSNYYLFLNGILQATGSGSYNSDNNSNWYVGRIPWASQTGYFNGYISNLRVVKGTALYTANYTPSTIPLTAISGTSLLTCQSNRFKDNSTNAYSVTINNGSPKVQTFSPFPATSAYSASVNGGSAYFDGSGDYLSVADSSDLNATTSYTFECWVYRLTNDEMVVFNRGGGYSGGWSGSNGIQYTVFFYSGSLYLQYWNGGGWSTISNTSPPMFQWVHLALGYDGSTVRFWVNGSSIGTSAAAIVVPTTTNLTYIGHHQASGASSYFNGYISDLRFIKGTDIYGVGNSTITVPTTPLTAISNTKLLLKSQNAGIYDSAASNDFETVGSAQVSTTQSKFGGSSMYFDGGSSSYLNLLNNPINSIGDFTVEGWFYSGVATSSFQCLFHFGANSNGNSLGSIAFFHGTASNGGASSVRTLLSTDGSTWAVDATSSTGVTSNNTWYHFAIVRCGGKVTTYINGNAVTSASLTATTALYAGSLNRIGQMYYSGGSFFYSGYLDDIRITKGVARYLYNFQPPTKAFPDSGYSSYTPPTTDSYFGQTTLLLHGDGTNGANNNTFLDSSTNAFTITRNGNATQGTFSPFSRAEGYWSNYFDGSSALYYSSTSPAIGTSDFTFETWMYPTSSTVSCPFALGPYGSISFEIFFNRTSEGQTNNKITLNAYGGGTFNSNASVPLNQWTHIAFVRISGTCKIYINGNLDNSTSFTYNFNQNGNMAVGREANYNGGYFNGYLSNLRLVVGTGVYTSNFTPPTTPLTAISGTQLLTCQSNRFKDNSTNGYVWTTISSPQVQTFIPFEPTTAYSASVNGGSMYQPAVDSDYGSFTTSIGSALQFTGDFTIECWIYITALGGDTSLYVTQSGNYHAFNVDSSNFNIYLNSGSPSNSIAHGLTLNSWNHVAMVRSGSTITLYTNGVSKGTISNSSTLGYSSPSLARNGGGQGGVTRYMADLRVVNGTAVYTGAFTPPTAPLTAVTNTKILLSGTNAGIIDNSGVSNFQTVGSVTVSTSQSKFGGSSLYVDGSGYYISPNSKSYDFGSGDWTIECWVYLNSLANISTLVSTFPNSGTITGWSFSIGTNGYLSLDTFVSGTEQYILTNSNAMTTGKWYHVAYTRIGGVNKLYVNGIICSTSFNNVTQDINSGGNPLKVGQQGYTGYIYPFNGYIDDLRITKGICRYPYNFTIPASAYPNS